MSRHHRGSYVLEYESDDSDYPPPIQVVRGKGDRVVKVGSEYGGSQRQGQRRHPIHRESSPAPVVVENFLTIPEHRQRSNSQGGQPQPNVIFVPQPSERSHSRHRRRSYSRSDESDDSYRSGSRGRHGRHSSYLSPETQAQLARLKLKDEEEAKEAAETAALQRYDERQRKQSERERVILLEAEEKARKQRDRETAMMLEAEEKRKRDKAEFEAKLAAAEAKRKHEEAEEKERRIQIITEEKAKEEKRKKEDEEMRKRILREEEERVEKEKAKKKKEEEEFQLKVKERFMKAGYAPEYIEAILAEKKKQSTETAIDLSRPTYIRVQRKHLYPDTLDAYGLPWEYDSTDSKYIIIKKYLSHDFQQELFRHTEKIRIRKEERLLTDGTGIVKETITTLKPTDVYKDKDKDEMYVVRRKSTSGRSRSRSTNRRSWMFT